jgi:hypothetical protein
MTTFKNERELLCAVTTHMIYNKGFNPDELNDQAFLITPSDVIDFIIDFVIEQELVDFEEPEEILKEEEKTEE